jgi:murein L,D-transpeptidase YafK
MISLPNVRAMALFAGCASILLLSSCSQLHKKIGDDDALSGEITVIDSGETAQKESLPVSDRSVEIVAKNSGPLNEQMKAKNLELGSPIFLQIFKQESEVDLWVQPGKGKDYVLFKTYPICNFSGDLGPKLKEGDKQSPEGFYQVKPSAMNPNSSYHLSFNLGFPNKLERQLGRTGSYLMVHGNCVSVGCYAMGDDQIEELYTLAEAAFKGGQKAFAVHAFPFRMTEENLNEHKYSQWYHFWKNMKEGYDAFGSTRTPPAISVAKQSYKIRTEKDIRPEPAITTFRDGRHTIDSKGDAKVDNDKAAAEWDRIMMDERVLSSEDEESDAGR